MLHIDPQSKVMRYRERAIQDNHRNVHSPPMEEIESQLGAHIGYKALLAASVLGAISCVYGIFIGLHDGLSAWEWLTVPAMGVVSVAIAVLLWSTGDRHIRALSIFVVLWLSFYLLSNLANAIEVIGNLPTAFIYLGWFPVLFAFIGGLVRGRTGIYITWFLFLAIAAILLSVVWRQPALAVHVQLFNAAIVNLAALGTFIAMLYAVAAYRSRYAAASARAQAVVEGAARLQAMSYRDVLTGLPNRKLLYERLTELLGQGKREDIGLAIHHLDLDRFQEINETFGPHVGDMALTRLAERLKGMLRHGDMLARTGGDEFIVIERDASGSVPARQLAERMAAAVNEPLQIAEESLRLSASIGSAVWRPPTPGRTVVQLKGDEDATVGPEGQLLLSEAETAMRAVKQTGGHGCKLFETGMSLVSNRRLAVRTGIWRALERGEFRLHYQPQVSLDDGQLIGAEALIRWQDPEYGLRSPAEFIPIAEESGAIVSIGNWVIREACLAAAAWPSDSVRIEVNVSPLQIERGDLLKVVKDALAESGLLPHRLGLELTESVFARTSDTRFQTVFSELRALGVRLVVDDFGTGYSSLLYLKHFPITMLKIDRAFVANMDSDATDYAIVKAIITFAHAMDIELLAEGVETDAQRAILIREGCRFGQGFLFDKALSGKAMEKRYFSS